MKLLLKFNVIFILVFGAGLGVTAYYSRQFLDANAEDQVKRQAELMMEAALSTRTYTSKQIGPLLEERARLEKTFIPQTVPAYSATEVFHYLRSQYPDYTYKEATLNPTDPRDRATDWEIDVVNTFRNNPRLKSLSHDVPYSVTGPALYLARPIKANGGCLDCHSTPELAPAPMVKIYGSVNGFGWKDGEIVGAQIVTVPKRVPEEIAARAWRRLMTFLGGMFLVTLVVLDLLLAAAVIRPVSRLSRMADEISKGNLQVPELPVRGSDEISVLAGSFNRMHRSLVKAMSMLGG